MSETVRQQIDLVRQFGISHKCDHCAAQVRPTDSAAMINYWRVTEVDGVGDWEWMGSLRGHLTCMRIAEPRADEQ